MADGGLTAPFLGALQACVSVLLTMCYGVAARRLKLIHELSINDMAGLSVKLFFPALILVNLGQELHLGSALNYLPVLAWSLIYTLSSIAMSYFISHALKLPPWVTPACAFNNTSSLPLLLLQSLESVGSLELIVPKGDNVSRAFERAQSYFLVCAVISKSIAYIAGPKMLHDGGDHDADDRTQETPPENPEQCAEEPTEERHRQPTQEQIDEETSLLPESAHKAKRRVGSRIKRVGRFVSSFFPARMRRELMAPFESGFADVAVLCAITGAVLGLVPQLHKAFFNHYNEGGIFNAWFTSSVKNIGKLFTTLQIFVVGCKLGVSFERMKASSDSGKIPMKAIVVIFLLRLVIWPALSISIIYGLAKRTKIVGNDPILWFTLMLMPSGPPALVISGLAELAKASELEKMAIAKTITIMYALSPVVCFTITGALKASQAALEYRKHQ